MARGKANLSQYCQMRSVKPQRRHCVHHNQCGLHGRQRHFGFVDKHAEAGGVDEIDLGLPHSTTALAAAIDMAREISSSS